MFLFYFFQLAFWQARSISLMEMYTEQGQHSEKCGDINFGLDYDFSSETLKLRVIQVSWPHSLTYSLCLKGRDLAARDLNGLSDPYVRITLLPDKKHRLETKIKRRTLNPRWNETFYFEGSQEINENYRFITWTLQGFHFLSYSPGFFIFMCLTMTDSPGMIQ